MSAPRLLVIGNVNADLVLGEVDGWPAVGTEIMVERSEMRAGGSAGNTALALSGLGVPHRLVASAGSDPNGVWLRGAFDPACCDWIADEGDTTLTVGIVHRGGDRAFFTTPGHLQRAGLADLAARIPNAPGPNAWALVSGIFLMPRLEAEGSALLALLARRGWHTAIDPGWPPQGWTARTAGLMRDWTAAASAVLVNAEEARGYAGTDDIEAAVAAMRRDMHHDAMLALKEGPRGARAWTGTQAARAASPPVRVVDTVGAGDTFNAAFLAALSAGRPLPDALAEGTACAACAISTWPRRYHA